MSFTLSDATLFVRCIEQANGANSLNYLRIQFKYYRDQFEITSHTKNNDMVRQAEKKQQASKRAPAASQPNERAAAAAADAFISHKHHTIIHYFVTFTFICVLYEIRKHNHMPQTTQHCTYKCGSCIEWQYPPDSSTQELKRILQINTKTTKKKKNEEELHEARMVRKNDVAMEKDDRANEIRWICQYP